MIAIALALLLIGLALAVLLANAVTRPPRPAGARRSWVDRFVDAVVGGDDVDTRPKP